VAGKTGVIIETIALLHIFALFDILFLSTGFLASSRESGSKRECYADYQTQFYGGERQ
jgi:hypothetical protein